MKNPALLQRLACVLWACALTPLAPAATHTIIPGTSVQGVIDQAEPGDTLLFVSGSYTDNLTIDKNLTLAPFPGHAVSLAGSLSVSAGQVLLSDLTLTNLSQTGGNIRLNKLSMTSLSQAGGTLQLYLTNLTGALSSSGSAESLTISECSFEANTSLGASGNVSISSTTFSGSLSISSAGNVSLSETTLSSSLSISSAENVSLSGSTLSSTLRISSVEKAVIFRSTMASSLTLTNTNAWVGYSQAQSLNASGNGHSVFIVGSEFDSTSYDVVRFSGNNCSFVLVNSVVRGSTSPSNVRILRSSGSSNTALISNNYIYNSSSKLDTSYLINIENGQSCRVLNNILHANSTSTYAIVASPGTEFSHNLLTGALTGAPYDGDFYRVDNLVTDALFVADAIPQLQAESPAHHAGTPDPLLANRDGTRNTIGPSGGPWLDPAGGTTDKPVVISFDLAPSFVIEGSSTEITLSNAIAVQP